MPAAARRKSSPRARSKRLEARISTDQKALFERAAMLSGRSLTDFVLAAAQEAAHAEIARRSMLRLAAAESAAFVDALLNSPKPNAALRRAAKRYAAAD